MKVAGTHAHSRQGKSAAPAALSDSPVTLQADPSSTYLRGLVFLPQSVLENCGMETVFG